MNRMFLTIAALLLFATTAFAESGKDSGFYGGVDVGYARVENSTQKIANDFVNLLGGSVTVVQDVSAPVGRIFAGYTINQNIALELGFVQTGDFNANVSGYTGGFVPYTVKETDSASGFELSAVIRPVTENGWHRFFVRAGAHNLNISSKLTSSFPGATAVNLDRSGNGFLIGIGYDTPISETLSCRSAYTYYDKIGGESDNYAHIVTIGLMAKF